jgi:hypothetical protein
MTIVSAKDPNAGPTTYVAPPQTVTYFVGERGQFRWEDVTRTDLAVNYRLPLFGTELFVEAEVLNAFNEQSQISGQTGLLNSRNAAQACRDASGAAMRCLAFNPFTETPVEGTHYAFPATFGTPLANDVTAFQLARTFQLSFGFRF